MFEENSVRERQRDAIAVERLRFQNVNLRPHENEKPAFLNSSISKRVLEKLRFRGRLLGVEGRPNVVCFQHCTVSSNKNEEL